MSYPLPAFHFSIEWAGTSVAFSKVRNLAMKTTLIESAKGASPAFGNEKQPGKPIYENFFLDRPVRNGDNEFFDWWRETQLFQEGGSVGSAFRRDITISLLNDQHEPVIVWKILNAIPLRLSYSDLDALGNTVLMETMEVACEGISVETI